jgi:alpha-galactosidase
VSNPLPRVCQAAQESGIETYGFCSASLDGYRLLWKLLTGQNVPYPYAAPREAWDMTLAGVNHFCWVLALRERGNGRDLLPLVRERLARGETTGNPLVEGLARETGWFLVPHDGHVHDFLPPSPHTRSLDHMSHGAADERSARLELLQRVANGEASWAPLLEHEAWEKPLDLVAALCGGSEAHLHSLNVPNHNIIAGLPPQVFVEVAAHVDKNGIHPQPATLPSQPLELCRRTAEVTDTIVRAAKRRSLTHLRKAIELDPTIIDKAAGWRAMQDCLKVHADVLPEWK